MADYEMKLSLNVLNHLGINLYSNVPAILAEVVANAWDADAEKVSITIDLHDKSIVIADDGHGMTRADVNAKFLTVGYQRRENGEQLTPKHKRPVMGRKGIGKLSLFSIADQVEVQTIREGEANGFTMDLPTIQKKIKDGVGTYEPETLPASDLAVTTGTRIVLRNLRKKITNTEAALRKRLARRFSVIGSERQFSVELNGRAIGIEDRSYGHKLQYLWEYGPKGRALADTTTTIEKTVQRSIPDVDGWIGSVKEAGALKDADGENLNRIVVMVRGKLAQEDILESFNEGGIYTKYLMGEIHADFLDLDDREDIATSSRQAMIEDDPRYQTLRKAIQSELKYIKSQWTNFRNDGGTRVAMEIPAVSEWFSELEGDDKTAAKKLFGRINELAVDDEMQRRTLIKHSVLAFESLRYRKNLDALNEITLANLADFALIFGQHTDLEATLYHQIIAGRIRVVRALRENVEENALEKVIQDHLFKNLWLLDPAWERATQTEYMEQRVDTEFGKIDAGLSDEEKQARIDIKYRQTGGRHVVIELKRANVVTNTTKLLEQVIKYRNALEKLLNADGKPNDVMEIICVVGKELSDWTTPKARERSERMFAEADARVVTYQNLIENAYKSYQEYLEKDRETGRVFALISAIEADLVAEDARDEAA